MFVKVVGPVTNIGGSVPLAGLSDLTELQVMCCRPVLSINISLSGRARAQTRVHAYSQTRVLLAFTCFLIFNAIDTQGDGGIPSWHIGVRRCSICGSFVLH